MRAKNYISLIAAVSCVPAFTAAQTVSSNRMGDIEFAGWDVLAYYFTLWRNEFLDYPWVVQVSYVILLLCSISVVYLFLLIAITDFKERRQNRMFRKLLKAYYNKLIEICESPDYIPREEIRSRLGYEEKKWKDWQMRIIGRLLVKVRADCDDEAFSKDNMRNVANMFGLDVFLENKLRFGFRANKVRLMQVVKYLRLPMAESVLVRLLNARNQTLSNDVRLYYMAQSDYEPLRFIEKKSYYNYRPWDCLEFHQIFKRRRQEGRVIPTFRSYIEATSSVELKVFLIRETAYWGSDEDVSAMKKFFDDEEFSLRSAAFACMGIRRYADCEEEMEATYNIQTEPLRRDMIEALHRIGSGKALDFFEYVYKNTVSVLTRQTVINCLWTYGESGKMMFHKLRAEASDKDRVLFDQIESISSLNKK